MIKKIIEGYLKKLTTEDIVALLVRVLESKGKDVLDKVIEKLKK